MGRTRLAGLGILLVGAAAGWMGRGRYDRAGADRPGDEVAGPEAAAEPERTLASATAGATPAADPARAHDDELRRILGDPAARALAGKVRNASRIDNECEIEVDTSLGPFRLPCGSDETPAVGDKFEIFGRPAATGQLEGSPPLLRPCWLEPIGTMARLRGGT